MVRSPGRSRRLPWVALGLLLTSGAVVAFALFTITQSARTLVWVTGTDVAPGETIERADLVLVAIGADPGVELLERGEEALVLGSVARGPIPAGTPLSAALVVPPGESVPAGYAVVGARLQPGQYPSARMGVGDRVELLAAVPATGTSARLEPAASLGTATVWAVDDSDSAAAGALFVSLLVPTDTATLAANAADLDRLRLALISASPDSAPADGSAADGTVGDGTVGDGTVDGTATAGAERDGSQQQEAEGDG